MWQRLSCAGGARPGAGGALRRLQDVQRECGAAELPVGRTGQNRLTAWLTKGAGEHAYDKLAEAWRKAKSRRRFLTGQKAWYPKKPQESRCSRHRQRPGPGIYPTIRTGGRSIRRWRQNHPRRTGGWKPSTPRSKTIHAGGKPSAPAVKPSRPAPRCAATAPRHQPATSMSFGQFVQSAHGSCWQRAKAADTGYDAYNAATMEPDQKSTARGENTSPWCMAAAKWPPHRRAITDMTIGEILTLATGYRHG